MPTTVKIADALAQLKAANEALDRKRKWVASNLFYLNTQLSTAAPNPAVATAYADVAAKETAVLAIRAAIAKSDAATTITVGGVSKTVAEWLLWVVNIACPHREWLLTLLDQFASKRALSLDGTYGLAANLSDATIETDLQALETQMTGLQAALSESNATVTVDLP